MASALTPLKGVSKQKWKCMMKNTKNMKRYIAVVYVWDKATNWSTSAWQVERMQWGVQQDLCDHSNNVLMGFWATEWSVSFAKLYTKGKSSKSSDRTDKLGVAIKSPYSSRHLSMISSWLHCCVVSFTNA